MMGDKEISPYFVAADSRFRILQGPGDAYTLDVDGTGDRLSIPYASFEVITSPNMSTAEAMARLRALNPSLNALLDFQDITAERIHVALLQLRVREESEQLAFEREVMDLPAGPLLP